MRKICNVLLLHKICLFVHTIASEMKTPEVLMTRCIMLSFTVKHLCIPCGNKFGKFYSCSRFHCKLAKHEINRMTSKLILKNDNYVE